jgi:4-hydroxybenzoate polyprenyltransferase
MISWIKRINIYLLERYALAATLPTALFTAWAMINVAKFLIPEIRFVLPQFLLISFNLFAFPLLMRICDEFKDKDSDRELFPDRCLPRGIVKYSDIKILGILLYSLFLAVNLLTLIQNFNSFSLILFFFLNFYLYLFLKYFFIPNIVKPSLIIALVISNPITWLSMFYNLNFIFEAKNNLFIVSLIFWIPCWIWEISRKIRAPEDETEYQTYSKAMGHKLSTIIPLLGFYLIIGILSFIINQPTHLYQLIMICIFLILSFISLNFLRLPSKNKSIIIHRASELFLTIFTLIEVCINYFYKN